MLLQCTGQVYFMQTELPSMIAISEKNYQLNNFFMVKATYTGNLHNGDSIIEGYQYSMTCTSIVRTSESLSKLHFIYSDNGMYWL